MFFIFLGVVAHFYYQTVFFFSHDEILNKSVKPESTRFSWWLSYLYLKKTQRSLKSTTYAAMNSFDLNGENEIL